MSAGTTHGISSKRKKLQFSAHIPSVPGPYRGKKIPLLDEPCMAHAKNERPTTSRNFWVSGLSTKIQVQREISSDKKDET